MNLSPRGRNVGLKREKKKPTEFSEATKALIQYVRIASDMEDDTERTIGEIENLRRMTLEQAKRGS